MIKLHLKFFKFTINLEIDCKCDKHKSEGEENAEKHEKPESNDITMEEYFYDDLEEENSEAETYIESDIEAQARKFAEELTSYKHEVKEFKTYDIPNADDIPPRHQIQDDVEIITDRFEKEIEDIIEGRR